MENEFYCVNASHNLSVNSTGTIKHCCMINGSSKGRVLNTDLEELWVEPWMQEVREYFRQGKRHPACSKCWNEEDAGRDSKRIRDNRKFDFKEGDGIKTLELNMGNTCNIKCRTCHPYSSSQWVKEFYDIKVDKEKTTYKQFLIDSKGYNNSWETESPLWANLEKIAEGVIVVDFYGGEPWLIKQQWEFIRTCVKNGWAKNMSLHYNTNGTQWPEELLPLLENFKFVNIGFSIDGLGERFEFMRHPAKWDEVYANMLKAKEWSKDRPNLYFDVCHTISALNVYYIPEVVDFFQKDWNVYLNLVHYPDYYCSQIFPDSIKEEICKKLETIDKSYESIWHQLPGIIQFVKDGTFEQWRWDNFTKEIAVHDAYRKEDYYTTFKEFGDLIKNYDNK